MMEFDWQTWYEQTRPVRVVVHRGQDHGHVRFMISEPTGSGYSFTLCRADARSLAYALEEHDWAADTWEWGEDYLPKLIAQAPAEGEQDG